MVLTSDLLYVTPSLILELPSFSPSSLCLPPRPDGYAYDLAEVSGSAVAVVEGKLTVCGGKG